MTPAQLDILKIDQDLMDMIHKDASGTFVDDCELLECYEFLFSASYRIAGTLR